MLYFDYNPNSHQGQKVKSQDLSSLLNYISSVARPGEEIILDLTDNSLPEEGAVALAQFIQKENFCITKIKLTGNPLGLKGYLTVFSAARNTKTDIEITEIELDDAFSMYADQDEDEGEEKIASENFLDPFEKDLRKLLSIMPRSVTSLRISGDDTYGKVIAKNVADVLADEKNTLLEVSLSNNCIGEVGYVLLAQVLENNKTLQKLEIFESDVSPMGHGDIVAVGRMLTKNCTLLELSLEDNLSNKITEIADALRVNRSLKRLNLGGCSIGNNGFSELAAALEKNDSLEYLDMTNNNIEEEGVKDLTKFLLANPKSALTHLILTDNQGIGSKGVISLAELLTASSCKITHLDLRGIELLCKGTTIKALKVLADAIAVNHSLCKILLPDIATELVVTPKYGDKSTLLRVKKLNEDRCDVMDYLVVELGNNAGIVKCNSKDVFDEVCQEYLADKLKLHETNQVCWTQIAPLMTFFRANRGHIFQNSGVSLIPEIMKMMQDKPVASNSSKSRTSKQEVEVKLDGKPCLSLDRFMNTIFFNANLTVVPTTQPADHVVAPTSSSSNNEAKHSQPRIH